MKQHIIVSVIGLFLFLTSNETFGVAISYETKKVKSTSIKQQFRQKLNWKNLFKPRKKWQQHLIKHAEKYFLGGILGLTALFTILKLIQIIAWSWLWVLAPIWISILLIILLILYVIIIFLLMPEPQELIPMPPEE